MSQNPFYFQPPWNSDEDNAPRDYSRSIPLPPSVSPAPQRPFDFPPGWSRSMSYPRTTAVSFSPSYPRTAPISVTPHRPSYEEALRVAGIEPGWAQEDVLARAQQNPDPEIAEWAERMHRQLNAPAYLQEIEDEQRRDRDWAHVHQLRLAENNEMDPVRRNVIHEEMVNAVNRANQNQLDDLVRRQPPIRTDGTRHRDGRPASRIPMESRVDLSEAAIRFLTTDEDVMQERLRRYGHDYDQQRELANYDMRLHPGYDGVRNQWQMQYGVDPPAAALVHLIGTVPGW